MKKKRELSERAILLKKVNDWMSGCPAADTGETADILAECQSLAVELGSSFEERGQAGEDVVRILEDYCEDIYQLSLAQGNPESCRRLTERIRGQLAEVSRRIEKDWPEDKKEIVFLPYKAAMWDSLESVWRAASRDGGCETYVVPIPYFDKNPDGTMGEMHDEADQYPSYVPVTPWREYPIEERRPDVIYIHNPYDRGNYVTSVHPCFYASALRKYTDMLVYIPYFIAIDNRVERQFCVTPGVLYAHRVIVQSEETRGIYLSELHEFERENNCEGVFGKAEEKILALGSPKYDKARTAGEEFYSIPEEWNRLTEKAGGGRKKVIFYNLAIEAMLARTEAMMDKIESTLEAFRDREDEVLLWRPHPLLKETLASMRPEVLPRYMAMENRYREEGWGIYDGTSQLYRAIAFSDAYYGDMSSVVELYAQTGKPILIQKVNG